MVKTKEQTQEQVGEQIRESVAETAIPVEAQDASIAEESISVVNELPPDETPQTKKDAPAPMTQTTSGSKAPMFTIEYPHEQKSKRFQGTGISPTIPSFFHRP